MRCEDIQTRLTAYALGELSLEERWQVSAHLRECATCQTALARTDWLAAALMKAGAPPVPAGLRERVMEAARGRPRASAASDWNPFKWWRMTPAPLHAAVGMALVIGLTAGLSVGREVLLGRDRITTARAIREAAPLNLLNLDYLSDTPDGSLAGAYIVLVSKGGERGQ